MKIFDQASSLELIYICIYIYIYVLLTYGTGPKRYAGPSGALFRATSENADMSTLINLTLCTSNFNLKNIEKENRCNHLKEK